MRKLGFVGLSLLLALASHSSQAAPQPPVRQVNAPYFSDGLHFDETAVFWLGQVSPHENYADIRVGYIDRALWVHVNIMDQHLWYDTSPTAATLTDWDAVTIYLDKRGNAGSTPTSDSFRFDGQTQLVRATGQLARQLIKGTAQLGCQSLSRLRRTIIGTAMCRRM